MAALYDQFSARAIRVLFLTRWKAGHRGATALEPEHLIESIVLEDQGDFAKAMGIPDDQVGIPVYTRRTPTSGDRGDPDSAPDLKLSCQFFTADVAAQILQKLERLFPKAEPIPESTDMPGSLALKRIFDGALALTKELGHKQVEPLHLLAAVLAEPSTASEVLRDAGVNKEAVIAAMATTKADDHT